MHNSAQGNVRTPGSFIQMALDFFYPKWSYVCELILNKRRTKFAGATSQGDPL
jgi:hypothetical protein